MPGPKGCLVPGGSALGGAWSRGVCLVPGGVFQHALGQTPLGTEFLTHATENITLPQTLFAGGNYSMFYLGLLIIKYNGLNFKIFNVRELEDCSE